MCHVLNLTHPADSQAEISAAAAKSLQCSPIDGSPPGSPVPGILQARILEQVAISFSQICLVENCTHVRVWTSRDRAREVNLQVTNFQMVVRPQDWMRS